MLYEVVIYFFYSIWIFALNISTFRIDKYLGIYIDNDEVIETEKDTEKEKEQTNKKEKETKVIIYEEKYLNKFKIQRECKKNNKPSEDLLNKLSSSFVMEKTPLGNVLMCYNIEKECFEYYSDSTMPYRYLEVVSRKYVLMNDCIFFYIDMEEELKEYEERKKEKEEKKVENVSMPVKNVFAKFKNYNKEGGTGHVNIAPPPKNNIVQNNIKMDNLLLKEKANRYSHQGKIINFNILKKVDRKNVNKKYTMTYADFKGLKNMEEIYEKEKIFKEENKEQ